MLLGRRHEADREAGDVGAARQHHRLVSADVDARAGDGDEIVPAQVLEAGEQSPHVGLAARLAGAQQVAVDEDPGGHGEEVPPS